MRLTASKALASSGHCANSPSDGKAGFNLLGAHSNSRAEGKKGDNVECKDLVT